MLLQHAPAHAAREHVAALAPSRAEVRLDVPGAGLPEWPRLAREAQLLAHRIAPGLERPLHGVFELRRRLASYSTALANYLVNRRRARAGREDLLPLYFIWTTNRTCNFRCRYCDDHTGARYPELDRRGQLGTAAGLRLLRVMRTRTPSVYFSGGEPTLRRDLPVFTRAARDLGYYPIVVNTNGSLFHRLLERPAWRGFLADVDLLVVSLDALDLRRLAEMWGTDTPEDVLRNLLLLRELAGPMRFKLMVNCVVQAGLVSEARAVLDLAEDLGIWFCAVPRNVGPRIDPAVLADPDYATFVAHLLARKQAGARISGSLRMNERLLTAAPFVCRNALKPHVDHDGRLAWPCKASVNRRPEYIPVLAFDDVDGLWTEAVRWIDPTGFQGPGRTQCGGACCWAQNYTTDEYVHGLLHPRSLVSAVAEFVTA